MPPNFEVHMAELKPSKKKASKVSCTVKRKYRFSEETKVRQKGQAELSQAEYEFALMNNCLE